MKLADFHHQISGNPQGHWLVFLHGLMGSLANWRRIAPAFEDQFRILTYDQRGHGKSFKPEHGYDAKDFANDLLGIMDAFEIEKAHLVGHSMGGRNALCFASMHPERLEKLVIEDIGPEGSFERGQNLIRRLEKIPVPFSSKQKAKEYLLTEFGDPKLGSFLYTSLKETDRGVDWAVNFKGIVETIELGRKTSRWNEFASLKIPTLVLRGEKSEELPREEFEKMLAVNKLTRGFEVPNSGHWIHFDQPQTFIQLLKDFFAGGTEG